MRRSTPHTPPLTHLQVDGFAQDSSAEFEELMRSENLSEIQEEV